MIRRTLILLTALALLVGVDRLRGLPGLVHPLLRVLGVALVLLGAVGGVPGAAVRVVRAVLGGAALAVGAVALGARLLGALLRLAALALGNGGLLLRGRVLLRCRG